MARRGAWSEIEEQRPDLLPGRRHRGLRKVGASAASFSRAETIKLQFGWPDATGSYKLVGSEVKVTNGVEAKSWDVEASAKLTSEQAADGLLMRHTAGKLGRFDMPADVPVEQREMFRLMMDVGLADTAVRVGPDGSWLGFEGAGNQIERVQALLDEQRSATLAKWEGKPEIDAFRTVYEQITAPQLAQQLEAGARENWNNEVGFWIGAELEVGSDYEIRNEVPHPMDPQGATYEVVTTFQIEGRVPCHGKDKQRGCVSIRRTSAADRAALAEIVEAQTVAMLANTEEGGHDRRDGRAK